jgi:hypothetical protein
MLEQLCAHLQEDDCINTTSVRYAGQDGTEFHLDMHTGQPLTQSNYTRSCYDPLNAELNPNCHLLILLGDLTFMGSCIVSLSNKMQRYTVYLYLEIATSTHHQENIKLYLQHLVFVTPLLLSAAIVEEVEPV